MTLNRAEAKVRRMSERWEESLVHKPVFVTMSVHDHCTQREALRPAHGWITKKPGTWWRDLMLPIIVGLSMLLLACNPPRHPPHIPRLLDRENGERVSCTSS